MEDNYLERIKFGGNVVGVAEDELKTSVDDDRDRSFVNYLWDEYVKAGSPKPPKKWIRQELPQYFKVVDVWPRWIEGSVVWPFHEGRPMIFITQYHVPPNLISQEFLIPGAMLYVFGCRVQSGEHSRMHYQITTQHGDFKGLYAEVEDLENVTEVTTKIKRS